MFESIPASRRPSINDLQRVIEPLAGYICASDEPRAVLNMVYSVLANEVTQVSRAARNQLANFGRANSRIPS